MPATSRKIGQEPLHDPIEGPNPSMAIAWVGDKINYIDKTIGGITWRRTYTWTGDNLTAVSVWVKL